MAQSARDGPPRRRNRVKDPFASVRAWGHCVTSHGHLERDCPRLPSSELPKRPIKALDAAQLQFVPSIYEKSESVGDTKGSGHRSARRLTRPGTGCSTVSPVGCQAGGAAATFLRGPQRPLGGLYLGRLDEPGEHGSGGDPMPCPGRSDVVHASHQYSRTIHRALTPTSRRPGRFGLVHGQPPRRGASLSLSTASCALNRRRRLRGPLVLYGQIWRMPTESLLRQPKRFIQIIM